MTLVRIRSESYPEIRLEDFYAYMPMHSYIFTPTRETWPASSVNARLPMQDKITASQWLDANRVL